jgi:hypothetical protein
MGRPRHHGGHGGGPNGADQDLRGSVSRRRYGYRGRGGVARPRDCPERHLRPRVRQGQRAWVRSDVRRPKSVSLVRASTDPVAEKVLAAAHEQAIAAAMAYLSPARPGTPGLLAVAAVSL